ncbi:hypothetical protein ACFY4B_31355 [Kitasatospora sp. NPDC001261]|uniref:hypothetical protein n=1 Tax=Kitasatospora sp. NPDC001261 TaxID=3364012 RepID=UPI0036A05940
MVDGAVAAGIPADYALVLRRLPGDTEKVTGGPATTVREFAERHARTWALEEK